MNNKQPLLSGNNQQFELFLIASVGLSGAEMLQFELAKSVAISALDGDGSVIWLKENIDALNNDTENVFRQKFPQFQERYQESNLYERNIRYNLLRSKAVDNNGYNLVNKLVLMEALSVVGAISDGIFNNFQLIHLVRSPLDIVRSFCQPQDRGLVPPIFAWAPEKNFNKMVHFNGNFRLGVDIPLKDNLRGKPAHVIAAELIRCHFELLGHFLDLMNGKIRSHIVHYEKLVSGPKATLKDLFEFIGVDSDSIRDDEEFYNHGSRRAEDIAGIANSSNIVNGDTEIFTPGQIQEVQEILGSAGERFGYSAQLETRSDPKIPDKT